MPDRPHSFKRFQLQLRKENRITLISIVNGANAVSYLRHVLNEPLEIVFAT